MGTQGPLVVTWAFLEEQIFSKILVSYDLARCTSSVQPSTFMWFANVYRDVAFLVKPLVNCFSDFVGEILIGFNHWVLYIYVASKVCFSVFFFHDCYSFGFYL